MNLLGWRNLCWEKDKKTGVFNIKSETKSRLYYRTLIVIQLGWLIFPVILTRVLSVEKFGVLNVLLSILLILSSLGVPIQVVTARYVSNYKQNDEQYKTGQFLRKCLFYISIVTIVLTALGLSLAQLMSEYLKIGNAYYIGIIVGASSLILILTVFTGLAQGMKRYWEMSFLYLSAHGVTLIVGSIMLLCGLGIYGVLLGVLAGIFTAGVAGLIISKYDLELTGPQNIELGRRVVLKQGLPILIISLSLVFLANIDIILIKHYFTPYEAGIYSVAAVLTKSIFCIIFTVIISKYTSAKKALLWGMVYAVIVTAVVSLFAKPLIGIMFGYKYVSGVPYVLLVSVYAMILFLLGIFSVFSVKLRRTKTLIWTSLAACTVDICLAIRFHANIAQILNILIGIGLVLLMVNVAVTILKKTSRGLVKTGS